MSLCELRGNSWAPSVRSRGRAPQNGAMDDASCEGPQQLRWPDDVPGWSAMDDRGRHPDDRRRRSRDQFGTGCAATPGVADGSRAPDRVAPIEAVGPAALGERPQPVAPRGGTQPPEVVVRTSSRRRKTATAYWEGPSIVVQMPSHVSRSERPELVEWLVRRLMAKRPHVSSSDDVLAERAASLADRYLDGIRPATVRWVSNQSRRWASCSTDTREIRLSDRLRPVPGWVLDATIVHELAHLVHPDHSPAFHTLADQFPRQREAAVFLEGYALGLEAKPWQSLDSGDCVDGTTVPDAGLVIAAREANSLVD
jgi:hypothetical protein